MFDFDVTACDKGLLPLVVLKVLRELSSKENPLTCERMFEILKNRDKNGNVIDMPQYEFPVQDCKSIKRQIKRLKHAGFKIEGVEKLPVNSDDIEKQYRIGRKGVYLKSDFPDEDLQTVMDAVLFSRYIDGAVAKNLIEKLGTLGSSKLRENNKQINRVDSVFHIRQKSFFKVLTAIQQGIREGKKVRVKEGRYAIKNGEKRILVKEKVVSPYYLAVVNGNYYVVAHVDKEDEQGAIEHLRVDKIVGAELLNARILDKKNTQLKTVNSFGEYIYSHPYFEEGRVEYVYFKVKSKKIDLAFDAFGESFDVKEEGKEYITIGVKCTIKEAYRWALEHAAFVEVLSPQTLRDKIRASVEELTMRYSGKDGDKYEKALRAYEYGGTLELYGMPLNGKIKHQKLKNVRNLRLADNGLTDVSFISNYLRSLRVVCIYNNPVQDLSALKDSKVYWLELDNLDVQDYGFLKEMPALKTLSLKLSGGEDYSALGELSQLESLRFSCPNADLSFLNNLSLRCLELNVGDTDYSPLYEMVGLKRLTIPFEVKEQLDVERLLKNSPELCISTDEGRRNAQKHNMALYGDNAYPRKVLHTAFGHTKVHIGKKEEIIEVVEKIFNSFPEREKQVAQLYYQELKSKEEIAKELSLSETGVQELVYEVAKKLRSDYYNAPLRKFVEEHDWNRNYSLKDIIK